MRFKEINHIIGNADLYLIDQILKGRFMEGATVLDLGCGEGRNLGYFLQNDFRILGIDADPMAIKMVQLWAKKIQPDYNRHHFIQGDLSHLDEYTSQNTIDVALAINILQWLPDRSSFIKVWNDLSKCLKVGGLLIVRIAVATENPEYSGSFFPEKDEILILAKKSYEELEPPLYLFRQNFPPEIVLILKKHT